jgi:predicted site-specific integrase-resolvase
MDFITIEMFAERLGVAPQSAYLMAQRGALPGSFKVGKLWRIPEDIVERLRTRHEQNAAAARTERGAEGAVDG